MACVLYQRSKNGSTYAYRSESYRDPRSGKPRSRREYLGRVDPVTGEIIPKRPRRKRAAGVGADAPDAEASVARVAALEARNRELEARVEELVGALAELREMNRGAAVVIGGVIDAEGRGA